MDEKVLEKNFGDFLKEKFVKKTGLDIEVQNAVDEIDPKITETAKEVCKATAGIIFLVSILTILSTIGLFTFTHVGIIIGGIDLWVILTYTCWFF